MKYLPYAKRLSEIRLVRVLFVGCIGVTVQTTLFEILGVWLALVPTSTATVVGAEAAILTGFYLNNRFSFRNRRHDISLLSRLVRFHAVVSGSVFLQWLFVFVTEHQTDNLVIIHSAYAAGIVLGFFWNYTLYLLVVWRHQEV